MPAALENNTAGPQARSQTDFGLAGLHTGLPPSRCGSRRYTVSATAIPLNSMRWMR